jgi:ABC transport system ATP-binding/permease protein
MIFNFDKMNDAVARKGTVPIIADIMASRWAFEAITTYQFQYNRYQKLIFELEKAESVSNYHQTYLLPELQQRLDNIKLNLSSTDASLKKQALDNLVVLRRGLQSQNMLRFAEGLDWNKDFSPGGFTPAVAARIKSRLDEASTYFGSKYNMASELKDGALTAYDKNPDKPAPLNELKNRYFNQALSDLLRNDNSKAKILEDELELKQQIDPVYNVPAYQGPFNYRTHFFAPFKWFAGIKMSTLWFNMLVIWFMTTLLYIALYYEWLRKGIEKLGQWGGQASVAWTQSPAAKALQVRLRPAPKALVAIEGKAKKEKKAMVEAKAEEEEA